MAPHLLWSCADIRPICGPCHHKGLRPLLETTVQSQMIPMTSSWDVPVCSNMAASVSYIPTWQLLCYSCNLQLSLFFIYALHQGFRGPSLCATQRTTLDGRASDSLFKQKTTYEPRSTCWLFLPPCSSAEDAELCDDPWIFNRSSAVFFCLWGFFLTTSPLNWSLMIFCVGLTVYMCMLTESVQLCTCISALYQIIPFFIIRKG